MSSTEEYQPTHYAILIDGDGTPPYPIPRDYNENFSDFVNRISELVVNGIVRYPYTAFDSVVKADHGQEDPKLVKSVVGTMNLLRQQRSA